MQMYKNVTEEMTRKKNILLERRSGRFTITERMILRATDSELKKIFNGIVIVKGEFNYNARSFEYIGYSKEFNKVAEGSYKDYQISLDEDGKRIVKETT